MNDDDRNDKIRHMVEQIIAEPEVRDLVLPILEALGALARKDTRHGHATVIRAPNVVSVIAVSSPSDFATIREQFRQSIDGAEALFRKLTAAGRKPSEN